MEQNPLDLLVEGEKLRRIKQKISRIEHVAYHYTNDSSVREAKERLLDIQKLVSEALTECEK